MTIYRHYSDHELQFDINLLTSMFPVALADALDLASSPKLETVPTVDTGSELVAAQAS
jgi:hypothetical protein